MAVILKNPGDSVVIRPADATDAEIRVSLNWSHEPPGLLKRIMGRGAVDLDLGCYYETRDGRRGVIDGLQFAHNEGGPRDRCTLQGCYDYLPYIWHSGDNNGMDSESAESILINPLGLDKIRRMIVYCFIYEGIGHWDDTDAVLTISFPGNDDVQVQVGRQQSDKRMCLVAGIDFEPGRVTVRRMAEFYDNHSAAGAVHGWDLRFSPGYK